MQLDPAAAAAGFRLQAHDTLLSTNTEALALARGGERGPLWLTARQQIAGRGRRGSQWISEPGNLFATLLLWDPAPADDAAQLSFVAALAVHDAVIERALTLPAKLELKWPNDVLYGNAKLAGILIESETFDQKLAVAIGIGVNCAHHPAQTSFPATDLAGAGVAISAADLFAALSGTMMRRLNQWRHGKGFTVIRSDWLKRAMGVGGEMLVRLPGGEVAGRFEALDDRGRLLLRIADGNLQTVTAGDVFPITGMPQRGQA
jgi:BirA family transcriptional regulator, biotin operon repressor / biotin---[acetyl-CoA-carboxylase] ligase